MGSNPTLRTRYRTQCSCNRLHGFLSTISIVQFPEEPVWRCVIHLVHEPTSFARRFDREAVDHTPGGDRLPLDFMTLVPDGHLVVPLEAEPVELVKPPGLNGYTHALLCQRLPDGVSDSQPAPLRTMSVIDLGVLKVPALAPM